MKKVIDQGHYSANIIDYGITSSKAGDPLVMIAFETLDNQNDRYELIWRGSLKSEKAQQITVKALLCCGMTGNDIQAVADGPAGNALDMQAPVSIKVEHELGTDGRPYAKVAWINRKTAQVAKLTKSDAKLKLGALNLKGMFAQSRSEMGIQSKPEVAMAPQAVPALEDLDDLPF